MSLLAALALLANPAHAKPTDPPGLRIDGVVPTAYEARLTLDPDEDRFSGTATASLTLAERQKVIWLNAIDLDITEASLTVAGEAVPVTVIEGDEHHVGFKVKKPISGEVQLSLSWTGDLREGMSDGVFVQQEGEDRYILTQFESTDARRAFPCVDDPQFKLPWTLTLDVPEDITPFANTPVTSESVEAGRRVVAFATSKPMPSYLVAFAAGPFEAVDGGPAGRNDTPTRVLVPRGRSEHASWAAESTPMVLANARAKKA